MKKGLLIATLLAALLGCTREDDQRAREKLEKAKEELKHDAKAAGREIKKNAHEASRELKKESDELKRKAQEK